MTADNGKQKSNQDFYVTKDNRTLVLGSVHNLGLDLKREALRTIATTNQPTLGPAHAPVTIVEYADLECPMCARLHEFLEKQLLPKYGDKVRVIFKEFPLVQIHDWSPAAAIANECVYQGVDRVTLAACLDSKASLPLVDAGANEGKRLGIQSTPTCFINGRMLVGYPSAEAYYTAVDAALKVAK